MKTLSFVDIRRLKQKWSLYFQIVRYKIAYSKCELDIFSIYKVIIFLMADIKKTERLRKICILHFFLLPNMQTNFKQFGNLLTGPQH